MDELVPKRVVEGSLIDPNLGRCQALCTDCGFEAEDLRCVHEAQPGHFIHFHNLGTLASPSTTKHVFATEASQRLHEIYKQNPIFVPGK